MGRTCKGICQFHKAKSVSNKIRYEIGQEKMHFLWDFFISAGYKMYLL